MWGQGGYSDQTDATQDTARQLDAAYAAHAPGRGAGGSAGGSGLSAQQTHGAGAYQQAAFQQQSRSLPWGPAFLQHNPQGMGVSPHLTGRAPQLSGWGGLPLLQGSGRGGQRVPTSHHGRRGGGSRGGGRSDQQFGGDSSTTLSEIIGILRSMPSSVQQLPERVLQLLSCLDSRAASALLKHLSQEGLNDRRWDVFHAIRTDERLRGLADVFLYTAQISLCSSTSELGKALDLYRQMAQRGIPRNVHTFSSLMNVAIKSGQYQVALDVYQDMLRDGCRPNLVTYNTLINVYGKLGQWSEAMRILDAMRAQGIDPVVRTYNTLMIACTTSNQWAEALQLYEQMVAAGMQANTTTYNALISAYSKAGQLDRVMQVFSQMVAAGCERSVITYSTLISACEKAGQWELAIQLFQRMPADGVKPNVVLWNSLIAACAQGAQWEQANELFEAMQRSGCAPDVVTYTTLIAAYGRTGRWRRALQMFTQMERMRCPPDHIVYETVVEALFDSGIRSAQQKALNIYHIAVQEGFIKTLAAVASAAPAANASSGAGAAAGSSSVSGGMTSSHAPDMGGSESGVVFVGALTSSMAMVSWLMWLHDMRQGVLQQGAASLPDKVVVRIGKGRQREFGAHVMIRNVVLAWLQLHRSPFTSTPEQQGNVRLEASGAQVSEWLSGSMSVAQALSACSVATSSGAISAGAEMDFTSEMATEVRCSEAYQVVRRFEATHCLNVPAMDTVYVAERRQLVRRLFQAGQALGVARELLHDSVLLMDRTMTCGLGFDRAVFPAVLGAALLVVTRQAVSSLLHTSALWTSTSLMAMAAATATQLSVDDVSRVLGVADDTLRSVEAIIRNALQQDTSSICACHILHLYLLRLGLSDESLSLDASPPGGQSGLGPVGSVLRGQGGGSGTTHTSLGEQETNYAAMGAVQEPWEPCADNSLEQDAYSLLDQAVCDSEFMNFRPSILAAAVLYAVRQARGVLPLWPTVLTLLTGCNEANTPELFAAISAAQRLIKPVM